MTPQESLCLNWHGDSFHMKGANSHGKTTAGVNGTNSNLLLDDFLKVPF